MAETVRRGKRDPSQKKNPRADQKDSWARFSKHCPKPKPAEREKGGKQEQQENQRGKKSNFFFFFSSVNHLLCQFSLVPKRDKRSIKNYIGKGLQRAVLACYSDVANVRCTEVQRYYSLFTALDFQYYYRSATGQGKVCSTQIFWSDVSGRNSEIRRVPSISKTGSNIRIVRENKSSCS